MKKYKLEYLPAAERDIDEIVDYLSARSISAAMSFLDHLDRAAEQISLFPDSAPLSRESSLKARGYRVLIVGDYLLFYVNQPEKARAVVLRIIHGKRDYISFF